VPAVTFTELHGNRADGFADLTAYPFSAAPAPGGAMVGAKPYVPWSLCQRE
jgi:hypothetical protein